MTTGNVLGLVGGVIGSMVGQPAIGYAFGSALGNAIDPPEGQNQHRQGPRYQDLKIQSSAYGQVIPIIYGTIRKAGNIIWGDDVTEVETESESDAGGGKGGGGGNTVTTTT
jgi:hypothetical protein